MNEITKKPDPVDIHVGSRVRLRRTMQGMSQEKLGSSLGITFQQIQKYEKGTNRIGAGRLLNIAGVLDTPIAFFFEDAPCETSGGSIGSDSPNYVVDFLSSSEGLQLNKAFVKIGNANVRKKLVELVKSLASDVEE